jgi:hypothetical protein
MTEEQISEIINAIVKGVSIDSIAAAEGEDIAVINGIVTIHAAEIQAKADYIKQIGE